MNVRVVGDVQQDEDGHVPEAGALQLSGVAGVEESLPRGAQVAVVQRLQDAPQVPAEAVIQTLPGDRERVQQLLQAVMSAGGHTPVFKTNSKSSSDNLEQKDALWELQHEDSTNIMPPGGIISTEVHVGQSHAGSCGLPVTAEQGYPHPVLEGRCPAGSRCFPQHT